MKKHIKDFNIGIAFSGGGIRAILFHSGVLHNLARHGLLENIKVISSVSGGSIFVGLLYSMNNGRWPTSKEYMINIFPFLRQIFCNLSIARYWYHHLANPLYWNYLPKRANFLGVTLRELWNIKGNLNELPEYPKWFIAATVSKNGKKWVFNRDYIGSKELGFAKPEDTALSEAIAASTAYPGIVGPFQLKTKKYTWYKDIPYSNSDKNKIVQPDNSIYYFYDGGLFDNLGCDSLFKKFGEELIDEIDSIIVSDACAPLSQEWFSKWKPLSRTKKMVDMILVNTDILRIRWMREYIEKNRSLGVLYRIDRHADELIPSHKKHLFKDSAFMSKDQLNVVRNLKTHLKKVSPAEFKYTIRNGYETAFIENRLYFDYYRNKSRTDL
ncbi:MAG: patatin-like phospholipase family protein [Victivallales bacterium]|nr:patatin-like phospholipase family protein [Victivallales bacterium]